MSILITSNGSPTNNGYLHLTTDTRDISQLSTGAVSTTILHTEGSNMLEVDKTATFSLAGGVDIAMGPTWLTGTYCRNARTIPDVTLSGSPGTFILHNSGQVVFDLLNISLAYIYDPVSLSGCSGIGYPLYVLEAGSTSQLYTGNAFGCGLGIVYHGGVWTPVVTFNTDNTTAATMWDNRASVQITMYITNGIIDTGTSSLSVNPVYTGYDVEISNADIKVNNISVFDRKFISCDYINNYITNNTLMGPLFNTTYDAYTIYNGGKTGYSKTILNSVYLSKNYIMGVDNNGNLLQYIGTDTSIRYENISMLNKGESYTLQAGSACFALLTSWDSDQPGLSFRKIHTSMPDGDYYILLVYLLAGSTIYNNFTWLTKVGNTLTLNSNVSTARCALIVYNQ